MELTHTVDGKHRPLLGGIKLATNSGSSTLGFAAVADEVLGFVMTGHSGEVGDQVWQPSRWLWNRVGQISANPPGHRFSDAAFVPSTVDIDPVVWPQRNITAWLPSYDIEPGTSVTKEGIATGETTGEVIGYYSFYPSWRTGYLFNQVVATFHGDKGDSGGPVFQLVDPAEPDNVRILGVVVGGEEGYTIYSPIEGIAYDLDLETPFSIQGVTGIVYESYWGMPLQGAEVKISLPGRTLRVYSSYGGSYRMLLPPGTYSVTATYPMHYPKTYNVQVVSGQFATLNYSLDPVYPGSPYPMGMPEGVTAGPQ